MKKDHPDFISRVRWDQSAADDLCLRSWMSNVIIWNLACVICHISYCCDLPKKNVSGTSRRQI